MDISCFYNDSVLLTRFYFCPFDFLKLSPEAYEEIEEVKAMKTNKSTKNVRDEKKC